MQVVFKVNGFIPTFALSNLINLMKVIFTLVMALLSLSPVFAQEEDHIRKVLQEQQSAWNRGDLEGYMKLGYWNSDSLVFIGKNGPQFGWNKTLANYRKSYPDVQAMGRLEFGDLNVEMLDERHAFVRGAWKLAREKDTLRGYFTLLFRKIDGKWLIVADHSS